ncbi:MAG: uroporphyrinogen decarboxylase family protein [Dehalococcoidia bacterium]|nr:uroporphyrinogen decarboxylase family protein [Dehalococcoidia bacterium]
MMLRDLLSGKETSRAPFVPIVYGMASRLENMSTEEMAAEPGNLSRCLRNAQRLFGYDAVLNSFDPILEAEACGCQVSRAGGDAQVVSHSLASPNQISVFEPQAVGCQGRAPVVLEATKRLRQEVGEADLIGVVTGPFTLAGQLRGDGFLEGLNSGSSLDEEVLELAGDACLTMARLYCELRVDAIMAVEVLPSAVDESLLSLLAGPLTSLWNVVRYYKAYPLLMVRCEANPPLDGIFALGADGVLCSGPFKLKELKAKALARNASFSLGIPSRRFLAEKGEAVQSVADCLFQARGAKFFLASEWEVPLETPPENLHEMVRAVREANN